ncbi:hypothetical protein P3S68_014653 [Capsicum galapagoense]
MTNLMNMYRKISWAEYKCPNWFPLEVHKLLSRILDPNPHTRILIANIKKSSWFKKGSESRHIRTKQLVNQNIIIDGNVVSSSNLENYSSSDTKLELAKPGNINAFAIISLSSGFDLFGLFVRKNQKEELQFISARPAPVIISKLEKVGRNLSLDIQKQEGGFFRLEGLNESRYGTLYIDACIFEITESYCFVELKWSCGDAIEYQNMSDQLLRELFVHGKE